jgi:hypothetical protein
MGQYWENVNIQGQEFCVSKILYLKKVSSWRVKKEEAVVDSLANLGEV